MTMTLLITLILCFPLAGFLITGIGFNQIPAKIGALIASGSIVASFILCIVISASPLFAQGSRLIHLFTWISTAHLSIGFEFLVDPLTRVMLLIITGVGSLIHVYSIGYMKDDEGQNRFFSYMNLFVFSMLLLVLAANYAIMFIGWEGVGLCSYLLIGFWYKNQDFNNAAKKAFIMNRIGDLGFLLGMFLLFTTFGSLDFIRIFPVAKSIPSGSGTMIAITMLLLLGAVGKSAQIPLYTWLPDAMAGPTPVSALIHAATMVTAGVYMIARSSILYVLAPQTMFVIVLIGIFTALFSAIIAVYQNDIKKILAYSTISQLGFMFIALGLGAFTGAVFHLTTHAFFKALLFLAAGSIIHALHGEQDVRKMGGLKNYLPRTWWVFLIGTISIAGIFPFAGFFSKDQILSAAHEKSLALWILAMIGVALTAFYMFRLLYLVFSGSFRGDEKKLNGIRESSGVMMKPMIILAFLSFSGGLINLPEFTGINAWLSAYLGPVFADSSALMQNAAHHSNKMTELFLAGCSMTVVLIVIVITWSVYGKNRLVTQENKVENNFFIRLAVNKFYVDEIYDFLIVSPLKKVSDFLYDWVEVRFIDRIINGIGSLTIRSGNLLRYLQTGHVGFYLFMMVVGIIAILLFNIVLI